eukprot:Tbor_TRINITY_DN5381_c3_g4::TRINITY_DN5381_c3_g4_i1::g.4646::m.4646/K00161/PDHA, pdhA; pyruvate dehydrogenase E1 component alpha subunit
MFRSVKPILSAVTMTIELKPLKPYIIHTAGVELPPLPTEIEVSSDKLLENLETMLRMRRMESICDQAYKMKKIRGFCHLYIGQEAIPVGMGNILTLDDAIVTAYRDHCWYVSRGGAVHEVFAEMFGKQGGASKGKGGSMHMYKTSANYYGGNGIVGAQVPIGAGLAWKYAYTNGTEKPQHVACTFYGDGAANQGQIFEAMNMAALLKLPCIFVCENNQFGMGTSKKRGSYDSEFYRRGAYIPGIKVDGMDLLAIQEGTRWAKEYCLAGNGPIVMEMDSYRYVGHSMSDPDSVYRSRSDVQTVRNERDCVQKLRAMMIKLGMLTEEDFKAMERKIKKEIDSELQIAEAMPNTNMAELVTDIYAGEDRVPVRSCQGTVFI